MIKNKMKELYNKIKTFVLDHIEVILLCVGFIVTIIGIINAKRHTKSNLDDDLFKVMTSCTRYGLIYDFNEPICMAGDIPMSWDNIKADDEITGIAFFVK